jgi:hypothetical protein
MNKKIKKPSDYDQFSFRISEEKKDELNALIEEILEVQRKNKKEDEYTPKKNALIIEALTLGLNQIKKKLYK